MFDGWRSFRSAHDHRTEHWWCWEIVKVPTTQITTPGRRIKPALIGVDFGGQPGPPNNSETPMHLSIFTTFCPPNNFVCSPSIFVKSMPVSAVSVLQAKRPNHTRSSCPNINCWLLFIVNFSHGLLFYSWRSRKAWIPLMSRSRLNCINWNTCTKTVLW